MSSALAISGVTAALQYYLGNVYSGLSSLFGGTVVVSSQAPDLVQNSLGDGSTLQNQVNLFLHQVTHNVGWRNVGLPSLAADGKTVLKNPPLALDLHYLLTAYGSSDWQAEALLGYALLMLHQNPVIARSQVSAALQALPTSNPSNPLSAELGASNNDLTVYGATEAGPGATHALVMPAEALIAAINAPDRKSVV